MKIWEKQLTQFWQIFDCVGKNEDVDDEIWGNEFDFWTLHPEIRN